MRHEKNLPKLFLCLFLTPYFPSNGLFTIMTPIYTHEYRKFRNIFNCIALKLHNNCIPSTHIHTNTKYAIKYHTKFQSFIEMKLANCHTPKCQNSIMNKILFPSMRKPLIYKYACACADMKII